MTESTAEHTGAKRSQASRVLLLGDDGRMTDLFGRAFPDVVLKIKTKMTDGILHMGREPYALVLINAESLEHRSAQVVKALRELNGETLILLYGDAYTEVFARETLLSGADDYLIWPVPEAELREYLDRTERGPRGGRMKVQSEKTRLLDQYRRLSDVAGQDKAELIRQVEKMLQKVFGVRWVAFEEIDGAAGTGKHNAAKSEHRIDGPLGPIGRLRLGPTLPGGRATPPELVSEICLFVGSLIYLARRCEGLRHLATVDELTGAYNRRYLEFYLQQLIAEHSEHPCEMALLLFDIDDFKHYNDTYGHVIGDDILKQVTQLSRRCCRDQDVVARIGGDEFAVLFWAAGQKRERYENNAASSTGDFPSRGASHTDTAFFLSNRFRRVLRTSEFPALGPEARGNLTISGGLACFGRNGNSAGQLFMRADEALLSAKRSGKNRIYLVGQPEA